MAPSVFINFFVLSPIALMGKGVKYAMRLMMTKTEVLIQK